MNSQKLRNDALVKRFEADARTLVPISDEIGGTVLYLKGRPAYYVLNGEWFQAVQSPRRDDVGDPTPDGLLVSPPVPTTPGMDEFVSTS